MKANKTKVLRPPEKFKDCRDSMLPRYQERPGCPCDRCVRKEEAARKTVPDPPYAAGTRYGLIRREVLRRSDDE